MPTSPLSLAAFALGAFVLFALASLVVPLFYPAPERADVRRVILDAGTLAMLAGGAVASFYFAHAFHLFGQ